MRTEGKRGDCPEWYKTLRAAKLLNCPPWELEKQDMFWAAAALEAEKIESDAQIFLDEQAARRKRQRGH